MSAPDPDWISLSQLQQRYGIKRSALNERLHTLNIPFIKRDRKAGIAITDLEQLDALYQHLEAGETLDNCEQVDVIDAYPKTDAVVTVSPAVDLTSSSQAYKLATFVDAVLSQRSPIDPIQDLTQRLDLLEKAATHGWLLPTSELATAVGLSRRSLGKHRRFDQYGFVFTKAGHHGAETAWRVEKLVVKHKQKKKSKLITLDLEMTVNTGDHTKLTQRIRGRLWSKPFKLGKSTYVLN